MKNIFFPALLAAAVLDAAPALGIVRLDPTFGQEGLVLTPVLLPSTGVRAIALQADGKIIAAGTGGLHWVIARYTVTGALDPSFGSGGLITGGPTNQEQAYAVAIQSDGRIVVAGYGDLGGSAHFLVARYLSNGSPDSSFGVGGFVLTALTTGIDQAEALAIQPDGRIVAAGPVGFTPTGGDFGVARYLTDGSPDASFGTGGAAVIDMGGSQDEPRGLVIDSAGRIALGGLAIGPSAHNRFALARLDPDGQPDATFGTGGRVFTDFPEDAGCFALTLQSDQKLVAAGSAGNPGVEFAVIRYSNDGSLDSSFANGGIALNPISGNGQAFAVATDSVGRILAAGSSFGGSGATFALARWLPSGEPDLSVGPGGWITPDAGGGNPLATSGAAAIALQRDGKILLGGSQILQVPGSPTAFVLVRLEEQSVPVPALSAMGLAVSGIGLALIALLVLRRS